MNVQNSVKPLKTLFSATAVAGEIHIQQDYIVLLLVKQVRDLLRIPFAVNVVKMSFKQQLGSSQYIPVIVNNQYRKIGRATSELQSLMRISYAVFCLKKKRHI